MTEKKTLAQSSDVVTSYNRIADHVANLRAAISSNNIAALPSIINDLQASAMLLISHAALVADKEVATELEVSSNLSNKYSFKDL